MVPAKTGHQKNQLGMIMGTGCVVVLLIQFIGYVLENLGYFPLSNNYCLFLTTGKWDDDQLYYVWNIT